jgi:hypothetical protein
MAFLLGSDRHDVTDDGMEGREKVLDGIADEDVQWLLCG